MKRSEMIKELSLYAQELSNEGYTPGSIAEFLLDKAEELGMLPPTQAPSLVEDTRNGGIKHGPALRVWDTEYDPGAEMDRQMACGGQTMPKEAYDNITQEEWDEAQSYEAIKYEE